MISGVEGVVLNVTNDTFGSMGQSTFVTAGTPGKGPYSLPSPWRRAAAILIASG